MEYFLFLSYLLLSVLLLGHLAKKNTIQLAPRLAISAFLLKVLMGCLYGYIFQKYYGGDDTWRYHFQSIQETRFLKKDPLNFLVSIVNPVRYRHYFMGSYWKELEYVFLIKLLAIFNVFSGGHYYVNVVLFSLTTFGGGYLCFLFFQGLFPDRKRILQAIFFFFIPLVFWTSGIRKDGLILLFAGLILFHFQRFLTERRGKDIIIAGISLVPLFIVRNYIALSLLPALICWAVAFYSRISPWKIFSVLYGLGLVIFFASATWGPVNLPAEIVERQDEFFRLKGGSYVSLDTLNTHPVSFLRVLPEALNHVFLRPYPGEQSSALFRFSALETYFVVTVFLVFVFFPRKDRYALLRRPAIPAIIFFCLSNYLLIGYTIPFLGAIVRYRIVFETLLLALVASLTDWAAILYKARRVFQFAK